MISARHRLEAEHGLEHDQPRHELSGDVEEQHQGEDGDEQTHAVAPVAVAEVLGDRAVAELVPELATILIVMRTPK